VAVAGPQPCAAAARSDWRQLPGLSGKLQAALYDFGIEDSFRLAAYRLNVHYGFALSPERIRWTTLKRAKGIAEDLDDRQPVRTLPGKGAEAIAAQSDGSMVWLVTTGSRGDKRKQRELDWNEARLCAALAEESATIFYEGLIGDVDETGEAWSQAVYRAGWYRYLYPADGRRSGLDGRTDGPLLSRQRFPFGSLPRVRLSRCRSPDVRSQGKAKRWLQQQIKGKKEQVLEELAAKI
jgi:hypothetical protein